jgi:hypothetical protein
VEVIMNTKFVIGRYYKYVGDARNQVVCKVLTSTEKGRYATMWVLYSFYTTRGNWHGESRNYQHFTSYPEMYKEISETEALELATLGHDL